MAMASELAPRSNLQLARFAWFVVFYNVLVIVWGALVRASGSGAGCGDHWPLCNGQVIPVSPGFHTIIEFTHRMMTGGSTFLMIGLLVWTFRATRRGHAARWFAIASMLLLVNEALLGALLVKLGYVTDNQSAGRMVLLSIHLSNTLLLVAAMTLTARFLSPLQAVRPQSWRGLHWAADFGWAVAGLLATVAVGVSGSMAALGDTLYPAGSLQQAFAQDLSAKSPLLLRLRLVHPISALIAAAFVLWLVVRARRAAPYESAPRNLSRLLLTLLALQFALGIADVLLLAPAWMQLLHLLGADLYWVSLVLLAAETIWPIESKSLRPVANAPRPMSTLA